MNKHRTNPDAPHIRVSKPHIYRAHGRWGWRYKPERHGYPDFEHRVTCQRIREWVRGIDARGARGWYGNPHREGDR